MARACASSARSRSTTPTCSPSPQRVENTGDAPVTAAPLRPGQPLGHAADAGLLHPARGADRRCWTARCDEIDYGDLQEDGEIEFASDGRLARHHRQVLAGRPGARPESAVKARFLHHRSPTAQDRYQADFLGRAGHGGARQHGRDHRPALRRRQGGQLLDHYAGRVSASRCSTARSISAGSTS